MSTALPRARRAQPRDANVACWRGVIASLLRKVLVKTALVTATLALGCPSTPEAPANSAERERPQGVVDSEPAPPAEKRPEASPGVQDDGSIVSAVTWFPGTLEAALAAAKAEGKLVLVDVGAYWCPSCHRLDEEVFVRPEVGELIGDGYIAVHIDAEKGEGPDVVAQYKVLAYPTLLVLESSGIEKGRIVDFVEPDALVAALQRIARGDNVLADLVAAVESDPDAAKARWALGQAYALAAREREAEEQFEVVTLADPRDAMGLHSEVLHARAMYFRYKLHGDRAGAIEALGELQRRFPDSKAAQRAHRTIGRLHNELGDPDRAIAALDAMLATDPEDVRLAASYGWFSFRERCKPEVGLRVVTAALQGAPDDAELHYLRAELEHLVGNDAAALDAIRRASELEPRSAFFKRQVRRFGELAGA
jgi:tetratricopeptide (TPR) repeat protein